MVTKNNSHAKGARNVGNEHFSKKKYYDALLHYNQSLCVAEVGSESLAIAYGNRSAVYIKLNQFDLCLENIQRARDSNYPKDKIEKLNKREEECKELMKTQKPNPDDDPFNFFKLSYPPNPKYPQIIDCLQLHKNKTLGVITTRDLKTGDIIAIEEPVCAIVNCLDRFECCNLCMKVNLLSLIPCLGCAMAMFCSDECREKSMVGFHYYKCNNNNIRFTDATAEFMIHQMVECLAAFDYNVKKLKKFLNAHKGKNLLDFDMSNPDDPMYKKNIVLLWSSTCYPINDSDKGRSIFYEFFASFTKHTPKLKKLWASDQNFLSNLIQSLLYNRSNDVSQLFTTAGSSVQGKKVAARKVGTGSYLFGGILNHSCDPNVRRVFANNKSIFYVCKPIKKGSEIFCAISNFAHIEKAERQEVIKVLFESVCDCTACKNDWPTFDGLRAIDPTFQYRSFNPFVSHKKAKKIVAQNNAYVDKNYKEDDPTKEVYATIDVTTFLFWVLTRPSFYP